MRNKVRALQEALSRAAKQSLDRKFGALYDKIYREDVVVEAWKRVRANKGAPGVDRQDFEYIEDVIGELALSGYVTGRVDAITTISRLKSLLDFETAYWGQFVEREKVIARIEVITGADYAGAGRTHE